ncbi:MAG: GspE/PulE family protein, partial [Candidatus Sungbacteria bacterium]|nr:GspE/PulE family protein [Candidatus Sungbacteria bacterium]
MSTSKESAPIEDILNTILREAIVDQASDIHIEPLPEEMRIRFRIDGTLLEKWRRPLYEFEPLINRIKVLANFNITVRDVPQDGHITTIVYMLKSPPPLPPIPASSTISPEVTTPASPEKKHLSDTLSHLFFNQDTSKDNNDAPPPRQEAPPSASPQIPAPPPPPISVDPLTSDVPSRQLSVRVSLFPTLNGDATVLRLLNRENMLLQLNELGMDEDTLSRFRRLIAKDYGMVLITGPSGSGKTTTLYSLLETLKTKEKNIVTLEDPVELRLQDIRQSQVYADHGLSFASGMRSILRQDPDIIMVGEIRDPDTAENAVRASLIGRVVLSTIHANTTLGTIPRLIDMNVERSLIAYAINGVVAQRLVRKICPDCRIEYIPHQEFLTYFNLEPREHTFVKGGGCDSCRHTGYKGRTGLFEVLNFDDSVQTLIIEKAPMKTLE